MTTPVTRDEEFELTEVAIAEGRDGPQWQLSLKPAWSQFPLKGWIDQAEYPVAPARGVYRCIFQRGPLKDGKDGSALFHYQWRLVQFKAGDDVPSQTPKSVDTDGPQPVYGPDPKQPGPVSTYASQEDAKTRSIQRQVALKAAVEFLGTRKSVDYDQMVATQLAQEFYDWLSAPDNEDSPGATQQPPVARGAAPKPKAAPQDEAGRSAPAPETEGTPSVTDVRKFVPWAQGVYDVTGPEVLQAVGVETTKGIQAMGLDKARALLVEAWGEPA